MQNAERRATGGDAAQAGEEKNQGREDEGRRRLFMAGRIEGEVQQVRFAPATRAPIRGPWSLALVVDSA